MDFFTVWARAQNLQWVEAGRLDFSSRGSVFRYAESWLDAAWAYSLDPVHLPLAPANYYAANQQQLLPLFQQLLPQGWAAEIYALRNKKSSIHTAANTLFSKQLKKLPDSLASIRLTFGNTPLAEPTLPSWDEMDVYCTMHTQQAPEDWPLARYLALISGGCWRGNRAKITLLGKPNFWLAKWQMPSDSLNWPQIEFACMQLLKEAGFNVPARHLIPMQNEQWAYLIERFDLSQNEPGYFIPANVLLAQCELQDKKQDSQFDSQQDARQDTASYVALARCLRKYSSRAQMDVQDLFRRMLANVLLNNTQDLPHKFGLFYSLRTRQWRLCPVFGVRPNIPSSVQAIDLGTKTRIKTGMGMGTEGNKRSIKNALSLSVEFGLKHKQAEVILDELRTTLAPWNDVFEHCGVSGQARQQLKPFIRLQDF